MPRPKGSKNRTLEQQLEDARAKVAELEAKIAARKQKEAE